MMTFFVTTTPPNLSQRHKRLEMIVVQQDYDYNKIELRFFVSRAHGNGKDEKIIMMRISFDLGAGLYSILTRVICMTCAV